MKLLCASVEKLIEHQRVARPLAPKVLKDFFTSGIRNLDALNYHSITMSICNYLISLLTSGLWHLRPLAFGPNGLWPLWPLAPLAPQAPLASGPSSLWPLVVVGVFLFVKRA